MIDITPKWMDLCPQFCEWIMNGNTSQKELVCSEFKKLCKFADTVNNQNKKEVDQMEKITKITNKIKIKAGFEEDSDVPKEIADRAKSVGGAPKNEGRGYWSLIGRGMGGEVAYVMLPKGHPDIGKDCYDLSPNVNCGLTYGEGAIFGWDYAHAYNHGTPEEDIENALDYFLRREG